MSSKIYFTNINGLRFFAAALVLIAHVELLKEQLGFTNYAALLDSFNPGGIGVYFFFVLSGFLITYLLLAERTKTNDIDVRKFYIRRILRIWPLYYLITILSFFVLPQFEFMQVPWLVSHHEENFWVNLMLFVFMLPNLALAINPAVPHAGQLWSIGVEEQFYLAWPWLVKRKEKVMTTLVILFLAIFSVKVAVLLLLQVPGFGEMNGLLILKKTLAMSKFECMILGSVGAYLYFKKSKYLKYVYQDWLFYLSIAAVPLVFKFCPEPLKDGIHLPMSILFIIIILNFATNTKSKLSLENKTFNSLGKISYGIYMYHMMVIVFSIRFLDLIWGGLEDSWLHNSSIYLLSFILTIAISWLSYKFIETPILRKKDKFAVVQSSS